MNLSFSGADWLLLLSHFLSLSLMAVGGAITTAPDMHRFLVDEHLWLTDGQFASSIAVAQAAPGPNVLFIALLGWNVGMNAGGGPAAGPSAWGYAVFGALLTLLGMLIPSTVLVFTAARWGHQNRDRQAVRAFKQGMAPIVIGLLLSTGSILASSQGGSIGHWRLWLLTAVSALIVWRTRLHLLWLLGAGALLGWMGWL